MLGMVTPNLRAIYVRRTLKSACLCFFYDKPPSEDEEELASLIHTEVIADFPYHNIDFEIFALPFPQKIPKEGWCAYLRYEENE